MKHNSKSNHYHPNSNLTQLQQTLCDPINTTQQTNHYQLNSNSTQSQQTLFKFNYKQTNWSCHIYTMSTPHLGGSMLADTTEVRGHVTGVDEDDAAMCITNFTNQSIYYFTSPNDMPRMIPCTCDLSTQQC